MLSSLRNHFSQNWKSGLTVALVSVPLSISLGVASQSTPIAGIITAVWAGLIAAFFGGSNYNIIGPTGALSGILAAYASVHGLQTLPMLAFITGLIILVAYYFRLERYLIFIPGSTIHGFTIGVACIIILSQLNSALGLKDLPQHNEIAANAIESLRHLHTLSYAPFLLFIASLLFLLFLGRLRTIPGPIVLAPVGIMIGYTSSKGILPHLATLGTTFGELQADLFSKPQLTLTSSFLPTALTVALIAIIETMISARIADGITKTKHNQSKELFGLGLANMISGLMGGMPATAALARTALNIKSGARYKLSQGISSLSIALISIGFLRFFTYMPLAVIAALLVMIAISMIEKEHMVRLFKYDKANFAISLLVAFITIWQDPITGIGVGTALSLILFAQKISHGYYELSEHTAPHNEHFAADPHYIVYSIKGPLAYINSQAHSARFQSAEFNYPKNVILRLRIYYLDLDGVDALNEIIEYLESKGNRVLISEIKPHIAAFLNVQSHPYTNLVNRGLVFGTTQEAIEYLHLIR